jgi:hypothetical protein
VQAETHPPTPPPSSGAQETPEVDVAQQQRAARLAALEQDITGALGRRQFDRAEAAIDELAEMVGPTAEVERLREQLRAGRAEQEKREQIEQAAEAVGAALRAEDWEQADFARQRVETLDPRDERLATWRDLIDAGRARAEAEASPPAEEESQPAPPTVDEEKRVRATLARYVDSQNTLDWNLFVQVFPSIDENRQQVQRAWNGYRSQTVTLDVQSVRVDGDTAVAQCYRTVAVDPKVGGSQRAEGRYQFTLSKNDGAWIIDAIQPLP